VANSFATFLILFSVIWAALSVLLTFITAPIKIKRFIGGIAEANSPNINPKNGGIFMNIFRLVMIAVFLGSASQAMGIPTYNGIPLWKPYPSQSCPQGRLLYNQLTKQYDTADCPAPRNAKGCPQGYRFDKYFKTCRVPHPAGYYPVYDGDECESGMAMFQAYARGEVCM